MASAPKIKRWKSEEYCKWLREKNCIVCGDLETCVHHLKTRGSGGGDQYGIPVCVFCHNGFHSGYLNKQDYYQVALKFIGEYLSGKKTSIHSKVTD